MLIKSVPQAKLGEKDVFIKSVAQAMPQYYMCVFLSPPSVFEELQRLINSF